MSGKRACSAWTKRAHSRAFRKQIASDDGTAVAVVIVVVVRVLVLVLGRYDYAQRGGAAAAGVAARYSQPDSLSMYSPCPWL
jgi:hypothetical protein